MKTRLVAIPLQVILLSCLASVIGCSRTSKFIDATQGFSFQLQPYNYIDQVTVSDAKTDEILWSFCRDTSHSRKVSRFDSFNYSEVPVEMKEETAARPLRPGTKICVEVKYQYDSYTTANVSGIASFFRVIDKNTFELIEQPLKNTK